MSPKTFDKQTFQICGPSLFSHPLVNCICLSYLNLIVVASGSSMAASEEQNRAISGVLQALVTNVSNMTPEKINHITQQILSGNVPTTSIPEMKNAQLDQYDSNPGGFNRRRSRAILARKQAEKKRKDRVTLCPLNAFICFRCESSKEFDELVRTNDDQHTTAQSLLVLLRRSSQDLFVSCGRMTIGSTSGPSRPKRTLTFVMLTSKRSALTSSLPRLSACWASFLRTSIFEPWDGNLSFKRSPSIV
jgi:hypothetical protein